MTAETLSIAEAARRMNVTVRVLHRRVLSGDVPYVTPKGYAGHRIPDYVTAPPVEYI